MKSKYYMFLSILHRHQFLLFDNKYVSNIDNYNDYFKYRNFILDLYDEYKILYKNQISYLTNTHKRFLVKRCKIRKKEIHKILILVFIRDIANEILSYLSDKSINDTFKNKTLRETV